MGRQRVSIRARLLLAVMSILILVSAAMTWEVYDSAKRATYEAFDRVLLGSALAIADEVLIIDGDVQVNIPFVALEMLSATAQDRVFYKVTARNGQVVTGYDDLPPPPKIASLQLGVPYFYTAPYKGETVRIGLVSRYLSSPELSTRFVVMVAETTQARESLVQDLLQGVIIRQVALVGVIAAILWFGVRWGLRPLDRLKQALRRRTPDDLHPIGHDVPKEIGPLVEGINDLMARLFDSIQAMRRFTGNAAHQLRTPLAAIQTQTALALKAETPENLSQHLRYLDQSTRQSTRLINQMLSLAQIGPQGQRQGYEHLDLHRLCQEITADFVPQALAVQIDLGYAYLACDHGLFIEGNRGLIEEALRNLIHNALIYCPAYSDVTVELAVAGQKAVMRVRDTGNGIAPAVQETIFERFERGGRSDGDGCGLGLPIVKEIIERHGGTVSLQSDLGQGACFILCLPIIPT